MSTEPAPGQAPNINGRVFGLFPPTKTLDETILGKLKTRLAELSVGDTLHDFDWDRKTNSGIPDLKENLNGDYKTVYNNGLPSNYENVFDEEKLIKMIFMEDNELNIPLNKIKKIRENYKNFIDGRGGNKYNNEMSEPYMNNTTINGYQYKINYCDVKPIIKDGSEYKKGNTIDAAQMFTDLGITLEIDQNIALVVDMMSVSIDDILQNGYKINDKTKVYLIKAPEIENDPGGKKKLDDKQFKQPHERGVYYKAAIPYKIDPTTEYCYRFNSYDSPLTQFFTKYTFKLSELKYEHKYISSKLSTSLTIIPPNAIALPTINESGDKNEISALSKIINNLLNIFKKTEKKFETVSQEYEFNSAIQQKRSGDWLQALLACSIARKERDFCEYKQSSFLEKKDLEKASLEAEIPINFDKVILITHDRILLAFALLLGIDVWFTHNSPNTDDMMTRSLLGQNKKLSVKSILSYTITNAAEEKSIKKKYMEQFIIDWKNGVFAIPLINKKDITGYNVEVGSIKEDSKKKLKDITSNPINANTTTYKNFENATKEIFTQTFIMNKMNKDFPDFTTFLSVFETDEFFKTDWQCGTLTTPPQFKQTIELSQDELNIIITYGDKTNRNLNYYDIIAIRKKYDVLIAKYFALVKQWERYKDLTTYVKNITNKLKTNAIYKTIINWSISNHPKFNLDEIYKNVIPGDPISTYINDKNNFLYELNNIDNESKKFICDFYQNWRTAILSVTEENNTINFPKKMITKYKSNMLSFCCEIFINLKETPSAAPASQASASQAPASQAPAGAAAEEAKYTTELTELKKFIDDSVNEVQIIDSGIREITDVELRRDNSSILPEIEIGKVIAFNNSFKTTSDSRLNITVDEQIALDGTIVDFSNNNNTLKVEEGKSYHQVNSSTVVEVPINKMLKNNGAIITSDYRDDVVDLPNDTLLTNTTYTIDNAIHRQVTVVGGGRGSTYDDEQIGGANSRYNLICHPNNIDAPIYLNVVKLFKLNSFRLDVDIKYNVEDFLNECFNGILKINNEGDQDEILEIIKMTAATLRERLLGKGGGGNGSEEFKKKIEETVERNKRFETLLKEGKSPREEIEFKSNIEEEEKAKAKEEAEKGMSDMHMDTAMDMDKSSNFETYIQTTDIFLNDQMAFHPLLPLFLILRSYCYHLSVATIEELFDSDIYITYFLIINSIVKEIVSYNSSKNKNINKFISIIYGYGLRELFFTANQYHEWDNICMTTLGLDNQSEYNQFSGLNSIMSNLIAGEINQTEENKKFGEKCINNRIFSSFIRKINVKQYFNHNIESDSDIMSNFQTIVMEYYLKLGKKISNDQKGIISIDIDNYLIKSQLYTSTEQYMPIGTMMMENVSPLPSPPLREQIEVFSGGNYYKKTKRIRHSKKHKNTYRKNKHTNKKRNKSLRKIKNKKRKYSITKY